jgi:uncharacterized protein YbjT (DUF2867 family)
MRILLTGASGFVGARLLPELLRDGHQVVALARDPRRVRSEQIAARLGGLPRSTPAAGARSADARMRSAEAAVDSAAALANLRIAAGDVLTRRGLADALEGVEVAYYLIHSMETATGANPTAGVNTASKAAARSANGSTTGGRLDFPARERLAAENFADAAARAGVRRVIYLGGPVASWTPPGSQVASSRHLASRYAVERVLSAAIPDTVVMRASIVIGARSRSLRFMVRLVERMPVLTLPAWRRHRTRPIDARDIAQMLVAAASVAEVGGQTLDLGGPDVLTYGEMLERIAELMLVGRPSLGLRVSATPIVARVAAAIAAEDPELTRALMESLQGDLLPGGNEGTIHLRWAQLLGVHLHSFDAAVEHALREWEEVEPLAAR